MEKIKLAANLTTALTLTGLLGLHMSMPFLFGVWTELVVAGMGLLVLHMNSQLVGYMKKR